MIRLFASALMLIVLGTFATAQDSYKVKPGDVLRIEVLEDASLNRSALVLPDGSLSFPMAGASSVQAGGQSLAAVQARIVNGLAPNFATSPNVFVTVDSLSVPVPISGGGRTITVYAIGEVNAPGKASMAAGTTMLQFLAETGGFTKFAAKKRILLRRVDRKTGKAVSYKLNYKAFEQGASTSGAIILRDGDVIVVPERRLFE
ncbi:MAG: polysaccharide biosynthesis/export family protein [Paracoccaceae bacterium]